MLAFVFFVLLLAFGYSLVCQLRQSLDWPVVISLSATFGILGGTWLTFLLVLILGFTWGLPLAFLGLAGLSLMLTHGAKFPIRREPESWLWIVMTVLTIWLFCYAHWTHDLQVKPDGLYSAGDTWGDIALHLTLAANFAAESRFSWLFPIFHGAKLTYPFMLDFTSGLLARLGWNWHWSFLAPSVLLDLAIVQLLYALSVRLSGKPLAGFIAVALFIGSGSADGWLLAWHAWRLSGLNFTTFFSTLSLDYSHVTTANLNFTNLVTSVLMPQRGFALGIATVLAAMYLLAEQPTRRTVFIVSMLVGLLPFVHVQSWLVAVLVILGVLVLERRWELVKAATPGFIVAIPQLYFQVRNTNTGSFIHSYLGWMRAPSETVLHFWWVNFGLVLPLGLLVVLLSWKRYSLYTRGLFMLALGLFVVTNFYILQPNPYDNIKLILYWYLIFCVLIGGFIARFRWLLPLVLIMSLSGILTLDYDLHRSDLLISTDQVAWAKTVQQTVPEGETILTAQQHNHPVSMLSGRPIVMGYTGWLWTYGIDTTPTAADIQTIYAGGPRAKALLKKYDVRFVEVGPEEFEEYTVNQNFFAQFPIAASSADGVLYRLP